MSDLQDKYDALFSLYVAHIHDHRLGTGKECEDCIRLANQQIKDEIGRMRGNTDFAQDMPHDYRYGNTP